MEEYSVDYPGLHDERSRLAALQHYNIINSPPERSFDELTTLTGIIFKVPIVLISFIDEHTVHHKSSMGYGNEIAEVRNQSLFDESIKTKEVTVVKDINSITELSAHNKQNLQFFAAAPIITSDGQIIGTLSIMDHVSHPFDEAQKEILIGLAKVAMEKVMLRFTLEEEDRLRNERQHMLKTNEEIVGINKNLIEYKEEVARANSVLESVLDSYERLFKFTPVAIGICSGNDKHIWQANDALIATLSASGELIGQDLSNIITALDGESFHDLLDKVYHGKKPLHFPEAMLKIETQNGSITIYASLSLQPVTRMGDEPDNIMFIITDLTEQVIERKLSHEANEVLMNAIEVVGMGYAVVEFATGKMTTNEQLKNNYGYQAEEEFNYNDLFDAMVPSYRLTIKNAVQHAVDSNGLYRSEYEVKWKDGSVHWIRGFGKPVYDVSGKATHIIGLNQIIPKPNDA